MIFNIYIFIRLSYTTFMWIKIAGGATGWESRTWPFELDMVSTIVGKQIYEFFSALSFWKVFLLQNYKIINIISKNCIVIIIDSKPFRQIL